MRKSAIALGILLLSSSVFAQEKTIKLEDVVTKVSNGNYKVYENSLKVYQSKENIQKARADLLPKLNVWKIAGILLDPFSIFSDLSDVAPFLVPGNWFRMEEVKLLYLAEKEGYRALWANQINIAKTLYKDILLDRRLLTHITDSIVELQRIHKIVKTRELFGGASPGAARDIEIRILGLQEDQVNLKNLIAQEVDDFTYILGMPAGDKIKLLPVDMPDVPSMKPMVTSDYEFRVLATSPERRQYEHFLSVLSQVKNEVAYSVFGVSQISRGVAGGIFDNLPMPTGGGGLGQLPAMNIVEAQKEIMRTQKLGIEETLKRQLRAVVLQFNSDVSNYDNYVRRMTLANESKEAIIRRLQLGENINVLELSESTKLKIQSEAALLTVQYRVLNSKDRLHRLLFINDYSMNPPLIDSLKGKLR